MDIKAGIMVIILIILDMLLYYPFFKLMEKQKLANLLKVDTIKDKDKLTHQKEILNLFLF